MSESAKDIFTKVPPHERPKLFHDLERHRVELICKLPGQENIVRLRAERYDSGNVLICSLLRGTELPANLPQSAVVSFVLGEDRHFITTTLSHSGQENYGLSLSVDIFKLQRRQSYRIRIPESYAASVKLKKLRGETKLLAGRVQDLSTGGARVQFKGTDVDAKDGDTIEIEITIGQRPPFQTQAVVRHAKVDGRPPCQIFGLEFIGITSTIENRLFGLTMELHRELFSRRNER